MKVLLPFEKFLKENQYDKENPIFMQGRIFLKSDHENKSNFQMELHLTRI